jgi:hypothetical protein
LTVEQEEKVARGFEAYLLEGKAPSIELRDVFRRFKAWLLRVYKKAEALDVELTDEVRGVFDRLLATDEQIERSRRNPVFQPDPAIVAALNKAEAEKYIKKATEAAEAAKETLFRKALLQENRTQTKWWRETWAEVEKQNADLLAQTGLYNAINAITKGETLTGQTFEKSLKLDRKAVETIKGKEFVKYLPKGSTVKNGVDPSIVADMFSFGSADEMLSKMADAIPYADRLKQMTEDEMRQRHGDMLNDGTIEREAIEAYHNELRADQLESELEAVREKLGDKVWVPGTKQRKEVFDRSAEQLIDHLAIEKITPYRYERAEQRAAKYAGIATGLGNWEKAAEEKARQLLNHYLYKHARNAQEYVDKHVQQWSKLNQGRRQSRGPYRYRLRLCGPVHSGEAWHRPHGFRLRRVADAAAEGKYRRGGRFRGPDREYDPLG